MSTLISATLLLACAWQTTGPMAKPNAEALQAAIEQLGDEKIVVRDRASQLLWEAGIVAEPFLKKALLSTDAEVRMRARAILERFRFGIFADTPPEIVQIIHQFRNGDAGGRAAALTTLAERKQYQTLFFLIDAETDPNQRQQLMARFVQDPTSLIGQLVNDGQFAEAERLLDAVATSDQGMLSLAAYLLVRGTLDDVIRQTQQQLQLNPDPNRQRRLVYLLRAQGNLAAARQAAVAVQYSSLERALAFEAGDWKALAARPEWHTPQLPAAFQFNPANNNEFEPIERLGFAAAFHRLAGEPQLADKDLDEVKKIFEANVPARGFCLEALFLNDRAAEALELQKTTNPTTAFELLIYQHRYKEALELVKWTPATKIDGDWFKSLPVEGNQEFAQFYQRFRLACQVGRTLQSLGLKSEAKAVFDQVAVTAGEPPGAVPVAQLWLQLAVYEFRSNFIDQAFDHAARGMTDAGTNNQLFRSLFGLRGEEAETWAQLLSRSEGAQPLKTTLQQVHRLLQYPPPAGEAEGEFAQRVESAMRAAQDQPPPVKLRSLLHIGTTCLAREQPDLARKCWEPIAVESPLAAIQLGDLEAQLKRWPEAIRWYEVAWTKDRQQLIALYLSGIARENAGQKEAGKAARDKASLLAFGSRVRHTLALGLQQRDHTKAAQEQWEILLRTGPFEQWEQNDAARQLGDLLSETQPARSSQLSLQYMLGNLRTNFSFVDSESLLRMPFLVHKVQAQALVEAGKFQEAEREIELARAACPHDVRLAEDVVPLLDKANQKELAERLFRHQFDLLSGVVRDYPNSGFHRNNLAWLAARCHRELDVALENGEKAVELTPDYPGYLDTLAEVHFQRGKREKAMELEQRVVRMAPRNKNFRDQLERFEKAPLPQ